MQSRFGFNRNGLDALNRLLAIVVLLAGGGCASPSVPVEPVRVAFLHEGTAVTALPISSDRLLTVAHSVPVGGDFVATVTTADGWRSTGLIRVIDRGPLAGEVVPRAVDSTDDAGLAALDRDWSILWYEPGTLASGGVEIVTPALGDRVIITGFSEATGVRPVVFGGTVVHANAPAANTTTSFLVEPTNRLGSNPGLSGSPVFVERRVDGRAVLQLAGIYQAHATTDGRSAGLLRCITVPSAVGSTVAPVR